MSQRHFAGGMSAHPVRQKQQEFRVWIGVALTDNEDCVLLRVPLTEPLSEGDPVHYSVAA
ncbi:MAG: hypothetical protein AAF264_07480 [Pseudomonadota bacterium]